MEGGASRSFSATMGIGRGALFLAFLCIVVGETMDPVSIFVGVFGGPLGYVFVGVFFFCTGFGLGKFWGSL